MLSRSETKKVLREATQQRIAAEREAIWKASDIINLAARRNEEAFTIKILKDVPSVFYFAEQINRRYERPDWAAQRYGAL